jgi:hypothetical protein
MLLRLKLNKITRLDGLSGEFYKKVSYLVTDILVESYNEAFAYGELAIIRVNPYYLLTNYLLTNYRPITLANTDYKILVFILTNRLH